MRSKQWALLGATGLVAASDNGTVRELGAHGAYKDAVSDYGRKQAAVCQERYRLGLDVCPLVMQIPVTAVMVQCQRYGFSDGGRKQRRLAHNH